MLEFFRKNIGGLLGFIIVGALVFVFAMSFGTQSEGWGKGQSSFVAASVDGNDITETSYRIMLNLFGGRALGRDTAEFAGVQSSVVSALIERQLLLGLAEKAGISATSEEVEDRVVKNEFLVSQPIEALAQRISNPFAGVDPIRAARVLLKDGYRMPEQFETKDKLFDLEGFKKFVQYHLQATEENFIEEQRRELIAQRVREAIVAGVRVLDSEVRGSYDAENDTVSISYLRLTPSYFANQLNPTAEEIAAYAAEHKDAVQAYYETNKYKYTNLEKQARARHILVKVDPAATDAVKTEKRALAEGLLARAKGGEEFAALARQYSEDTGSGAQGGDLGYNAKGRMVPEFDDAMFALAPGQISDVVTTQYGFHIIKLEGFREGNVTVEEATPEIAEMLYRESEGAKRAETAANEYLARLKAGEPIEGLIPAPAGEDESPSDLRVRTTPPFERGATSIPGIGGAPDLAAAAFALATAAPVPDKAFNVRNDWFVIALKERVTPSDDGFAKQKDEIAERLLAEKRVAWLRSFVRNLRDTAEKEGRIQSEMLAAPPSSSKTDEDQGGDEKRSSAAEKDNDKGRNDNPPPAEAQKKKAAEDKGARAPADEPEGE
jgi:peptidyl-prolyl cis-trans isomerase D